MEQLTLDMIVKEKNKNKDIRFIDLFCGIGGFRLGFESQGFECVFSSDIDEHAREMYKANYGEEPYGDISEIDAKDIPDHEILLAGFPCQAFSICGRQKGFYDETRGTLFFEIYRIIDAKRPEVAVLENVQNLVKHDGGRTFQIIVSSLESLGYNVSHRVLNARDFNVPQNRERIVIIAHKSGSKFDFNQLNLTPATRLKDYLEKDGDFEYLNEDEYTLIDNYKEQPNSGLIFIGYRNKKIRTIGVRPGTLHLSRVHKQPNRIYSAEGMHPTIASQESSGRYFILVDGKVRKLTLNECFMLMGFPKDFKKIGTKGKIYERIGNSICVSMVKEVARQIKLQFFTSGGKENMAKEPHTEVLENIYKQASNVKELKELDLNKEQRSWVKAIVEKEETNKGVFTVLVTSLTHKIVNPEQDVRRHQSNMENGYSGRTLDTNYITPFLKHNGFNGAMKESGWLTRSLEQNLPYNLDYPGKITPKPVKEAFLNILNDIEENDASPQEYLKAVFAKSLIEKSKKIVQLINPIDKESKMTIKKIMNYLEKHFYYRYHSRGASILPVVAIYSIYQCMVEELKRFDGKILEPMASHHSSDRTSKAIGDIEVKYEGENDTFEGVEVKFDIPISYDMLLDAYKKFKHKNTQRYYILSTCGLKEGDEESLEELVAQIEKEHGCQVILNGLMPSIKYYLRLIENTDKFLSYYITNLNAHPDINFEHKITWNKIMEEDLE